jgi:hypothetical protein
MEKDAEYVNEYIFFDDLLVEVSEEAMSAPLHSNTGLVVFETTAKDGIGSGTLISRNLVLTAAHNIINSTFPTNKKDPTKNNIALKLSFYPGQRG